VERAQCRANGAPGNACITRISELSVAIKSKHDVKLLQKDLQNVIDWSEINDMALHKDKFEYMCHKFNHQYELSELPFVIEHYQYSVSKDTTLEPIHQLRDLGVIVSSNFS